MGHVANLLGDLDGGDAAQVGPERRDRPGVTAGVSSEESAEMKRLKRENAELRGANAMLKAPAVFVAELDRLGL